MIGFENVIVFSVVVLVVVGGFVVCFVVCTIFAAFVPDGFLAPFKYNESCRRKFKSSVSLNGAFFVVDGAEVGIGIEKGLIFFVDVVGISSISADEYSSELHGIVDVLILVIGARVALSVVFNVDAMSNNFEFAFTNVEVEAD